MPRKAGLQIKVKVQFFLNAQETVLLDRLVDTGLYGVNRGQAIRRILAEKLCRLYSNKRTQGE